METDYMVIRDSRKIVPTGISLSTHIEKRGFDLTNYRYIGQYNMGKSKLAEWVWHEDFEWYKSGREMSK